MLLYHDEVETIPSDVYFVSYIVSYLYTYYMKRMQNWNLNPFNDAKEIKFIYKSIEN